METDKKNLTSDDGLLSIEVKKNDDQHPEPDTSLETIMVIRRKDLENRRRKKLKKEEKGWRKPA